MRMTTDKLTDHEDWKDGMNAFRLQVIESLAIINEALKEINIKLKQKENTL